MKECARRMRFWVTGTKMGRRHELHGFEAMAEHGLKATDL